MTDITDLNGERDKRHGPDQEHVAVIVKDGRAEKWFEFTCAFACDGAEYSFTIWALDFADADRRLDALKASAKVDGQLYRTIQY